MPHPNDGIDPDFDAQLRGLFQEAEQVMEKSAPRKPEPTAEPRTAVAPPQVAVPPPAAAAPAAPATSKMDSEARREPIASLPQMLRPMVLGIEAMTRAAGENTSILGRLDKAATAAAQAQQDLPGLVGELRSMIDSKTALNQRMFDALHEELRGYKDGFLLESVHRPIIRDLITLYDDLAELHRQMGGAVAEHSPEKNPGELTVNLLSRLETMRMNMEHNLEFILEVLARLEVVALPPSTGKLDKRMQRAISVELADDPEEDATIIRTVKRGFSWKDRVLRAEEVVIKKWKEGFLVAIPGQETAAPDEK